MTPARKNPNVPREKTMLPYTYIITVLWRQLRVLAWDGTGHSYTAWKDALQEVPGHGETPCTVP